MEVMSFNIWSDAPRNRSWLQRRETIAAILQHSSLDLVGLQEATASMIQDLQGRLPQFRWIGVGRDDGQEAGEYVPIFFRDQRFSLEAHGHFWLAEPCTLPKRGWDGLCRRMVTWARLREKKGGGTVTHFNTHFDHFGRKAREESARLMLRKIEEIAGGEPAIVTGDLNTREGSTPYRILTGQRPFDSALELHPEALRDTRYDTAEAPTGPHKTYRGLLSMLGLGRIDYIFVKNGLRTLRHTVLEEGAGASDHRPVVATLALQRSSS